MFAQLGAVYLANPRLLKENAPNAYRLIKALRDNASQTAEDIVREDNQTQDEAVSTNLQAYLEKFGTPSKEAQSSRH